MLLMYYREYRSFAHIGANFDMSEAQGWRIITGLEELLNKSELFHLERKQRLRSETHWQTVVVDAGEHPGERLKKQRSCYSGRKKRHTPKSQVLMQAGSGRILSVRTGKGRRHDFHLWKSSGVRMHPQMQIALVTRAARALRSSTPTASSR